MKLVSVLIPTYNRVRFLPEAIESALKQTYKNVEIVVVDDGSTDSTEDLMDYYTKKYDNIHYYKLKHKNAANARNFGVTKCNGEYICLCDSDDIMNPERVKESVKRLEKGLDVFYGGYWYGDENGQVLSWNPVEELPTKENIKKSQVMAHGVVIARKKCFVENPYRDMDVNEDLALTLDWIKAGYKFGLYNKPLQIVRIHKGTLTINNNYKLSYQDQLDKLPKLKKEIEEL